MSHAHSWQGGRPAAAGPAGIRAGAVLSHAARAACPSPKHVAAGGSGPCTPLRPRPREASPRHMSVPHPWREEHLAGARWLWTCLPQVKPRPSHSSRVGANRPQPGPPPEGPQRCAAALWGARRGAAEATAFPATTRAPMAPRLSLVWSLSTENHAADTTVPALLPPSSRSWRKQAGRPDHCSSPPARHRDGACYHVRSGPCRRASEPLGQA